jgi:hypothetical protein
VGKIPLAQPQAKVCVLLSVLWLAVVDVCGLVVQCATSCLVAAFFVVLLGMGFSSNLAHFAVFCAFWSFLDFFGLAGG